MQIKQLLDEWERTGGGKPTAREYRVRLPVRDAARIAALRDLYPRKTEEQLITDLLGVALDALEAALPYQQGERVIAEDELGDPIYEDVGPTPRFLALTRQHAARLSGENDVGQNGVAVLSDPRADGR
ncbi:MAG: type 1 pili tip component [Candidatus Competibacteraceae bacterium]|nr:type 1 pili tip component [Candidatus Competibacteraceae bacterium]